MTPPLSAPQKLRNLTPNMRLAESVMLGNVNHARTALSAGANPDLPVLATHTRKVPKRVPAMLFCETKKRWKLADVLLEAGANPNAEHPYSKRSSLQLAASHSADRRAEAHAINLIEAGADVAKPLQSEHETTDFLHLVIKKKLSFKLIKPALLHGANIEAEDSNGKTVEACLEPHGSLEPSPSKEGVAYWTMRQHRLAPVALKDGSLQPQELRTQNAAGYSALDHWHTWDNYADMKDALKQANEPPLKASDLLEPLGGQKNAPTRLEVMLHICPDLITKIRDAALWKNETTQSLRAFQQAMPEEMRKDLPYFQLQSQISQRQSGQMKMGR